MHTSKSQIPPPTLTLSRVLPRLLLLICMTFAVTSCGNTRVTTLTAELSATATGSTEKVKTYLSELNEIHRQLFLDGEEVGDKTVSATPSIPTGLSPQEAEALAALIREVPPAEDASGAAPYYSGEAVQIRTAYAGVLEAYAVHLNLIASSNTSAQTQQALNNLQSRLQELGQQIIDVKLPNVQAVATKLQALTGPAVDLGKLTADTLVGHFRNTWTKEAIQKNEAIVSQVCTVLCDDINGAAQRAKTRSLRMIAVYKRYYGKIKNSRPLSAPEEQRRMAELNKLTKILQNIDEHNPSPTYKRIAQIHDKLASLVKPKGK
jgi:hypothetical protein